MARFDMELPDNILKDFEKIYNNTDQIFGDMTEAGAKVVEGIIRNTAPKAFHSSGIMHCLKLTRVYKTPSDGGINTKVAFYGYFKNENGQLTPAPLVCNMFEYGSSKKKYPKKPFLRKAFSNKAAIEAAMYEAQKKASGGLLTDE